METSRKTILLIGITVLLTLAGCTAVPLHQTGSVLTSTHMLAYGKRVPMDSFKIDDTIRYFVALTWDDVSKEPGYRTVTWNWYKEGKLISTNEWEAYIKVAPYELYTTRAASALGLGHFKIETLLDSKLMGSIEFEIK